MKKTVTLIALFAIVSCALLSVAVSAAGNILWTEDFSSANPANWMWDTSKFFVEDGVCKGWDEAKVHQSFFLTEEGGTRKYKESAWRIEAIAYDDGGADAENHSLGLWYADYIDPYATDDPTSWIIYKPVYDFENASLELEMEFTGDEAEPFRPANFPDDGVVLRTRISDDIAPVMGEWFSIGIRANAGVVSLFLNDRKVGEIAAYRGATSFTQRPSPVLLLNSGCYCGFDNLTVSTPDYDLFNEGMNNGGNKGGNDVGDPFPIETVVVTDTDENGNVVTRVETRPAANNGGAATGGNAARTGDAAIVVIAVMVAALGGAIAVGKVTGKKQ